MSHFSQQLSRGLSRQERHLRVRLLREGSYGAIKLTTFNTLPPALRLAKSLAADVHSRAV